MTDKVSVIDDSVSSESDYSEVGMKNFTRKNVALEMKGYSSSIVGEGNVSRRSRSSDEMKFVFENRRRTNVFMHTSTTKVP